jgi:mannosyltransferase
VTDRSAGSATVERILHPSRRLTAVILLAYALALGAIADRASLWGDEGFTAGMVRLPWSTMAADLTAIDVNMSTYYALVKAITALTGTSELGLRLVSLISVVAATALLPRLAKIVLGDRWAALAALLFAVNPFVVVLAVTARPYALLVLGQILTAMAVHRAVRSGTRRSWLIWAAGCGALLYVHLLAVLVIGGHLAYAMTRRPTPWRGLGVASPVLIVAAVPTVAFIAPRDTLGWVPQPTLVDTVRVIERVFGGPLFGTLLLLAALAGLTALARNALPERAIIIWSIAVPLAGILLLLPLQSLLIDLYLSILVVPISVMGAAGLSTVTRRRWRFLGTAGLVGAGLLTSVYRADAGTLGAPQDWRTADERLDAQIEPGDAVGFPNAFYRIVAEYYSTGSSEGWPIADPVLPQAAWGSLRPYELDRIKRLGVQAGSAAVLEQVGANDSVWLAGPDDELMVSATKTLTANGYKLTETVDLRDIRLAHLVRSG